MVDAVVVIGEGAGASVALRFAIAHPTRTHGVVLVSPPSPIAGVVENFREMTVHWDPSAITPSVENFLVRHHFGVSGAGSCEMSPVRKFSRAKLVNVDEEDENKEQAIEAFRGRLKSSVNPKNLRKFVDAFVRRSNVAGFLKEQLTVDALVVSNLSNRTQS